MLHSFEIGVFLGVQVAVAPSSLPLKGSRRSNKSVSRSAVFSQQSSGLTDSHSALLNTNIHPSHESNNLSRPQSLLPHPPFAGHYNLSSQPLPFAALASINIGNTVRVEDEAKTVPQPLAARKVSFASAVPSAVPEPELSAAPAAEVLARTGSAVEDTSAGAHIDEDPSLCLDWGDIVLCGKWST